MRVDRPSLLVLFLLLTACRPDSVELGSLIEDADARKVATTTGTRDPAAGPPPRRIVYEKPKGLHIDLPFLSGKKLMELDPAVLAEQLGVEISREDLGKGEEHIVFDRAEVWMIDGESYRIRQELAHPMDVPTALGVSGFPLDLGPPIDGAHELRWNRVWHLRRLRLERSASDSRLYTHIDAWWKLPRELR